MLLAAAGRAAAEDEIDRLLKEAAPPARFAGHEASFRVEERPHTCWWWDWHNPDRSKRWILKQYTTALPIILDGRLPVGLAPDWLIAPYPGADTRGRPTRQVKPATDTAGGAAVAVPAHQGLPW